MSRESLEATSTGVEDDGPGGFVADLHDDPPDRPAQTRRLRAALGTRPTNRLLVVVLVVLGVVVGVLGGSMSARQAGQARADGAARLVIALESTGGPDVAGAPAPVQDDLITVTVSLTGPVGGADSALVEKVSTPLGEFALFPALLIRPGAPPWRTLLRGRIDCAAVDTTGLVDGRLLDGSVATVRPTGSRRPASVDVLVANPTEPLDAASARCAPREPADALTVSGALVRADGSLVLTVSPAAGSPATTLVLASFARGSTEGFVELRAVRGTGTSTTYAVPDTRWTITATPALPARVAGPTTIRFDLQYACPQPGRRSSAAPVPAFPELTLATPGAREGQAVPLQEYDWSLLPTAATVAAGRACATTQARG